MRKILVILCMMCIGFIHYNSSKTGIESNKISYKVVNTISEKNVAKDKGSYFGGKFNIFIRKNAHGIEFLLLAIILSGTVFSYNKKGLDGVIYILFMILLVAVSDEFHQIFVEGRNSSVIDIIIDFLGGIIGSGVFYLAYYFIIPKFKNLKSRNLKENSYDKE